MSENLDPRIKREFDALIFSVLDSDKLTEAVIKRLHERRRKMIIRIVASILAAVLLVFGGKYIADHHLIGGSDVVTYQSEKSIAGEGLIQLPFSKLIQIDGSDPKKSTFDFDVKIKGGQRVLFWTHLNDRSYGIVGTMTAYMQGNDGKFRQFQVYEIGSGSNRQEIGHDGDGIYRYRLSITNQEVKSEMAVTIVIV